MAEVSRFWNGTTVGDAIASPYEANTVFADVVRAMSHTMGYPNQGAVINNPNAGGRLLATANLGTSSPVSVADGTAIVWGTWYNSSTPVSFVISTPATSTRIDRVVLRKTWATQQIRLVLLTGVEGGTEPVLTQTSGTTWDIPIAQVSTTTAGVVTVTDERNLSQPDNASVYVPWIATGALPSIAANIVGATANQVVTLPNSIPAEATAVVLIMQFVSGTFSVFEIATTALGGSSTVYSRTGAEANLIRMPIGVVPLATSRQFTISNGASVNVYFYVSGYFMPTF